MADLERLCELLGVDPQEAAQQIAQVCADEAAASERFYQVAKRSFDALNEQWQQAVVTVNSDASSSVSFDDLFKNAPVIQGRYTPVDSGTSFKTYMATLDTAPLSKQVNTLITENLNAALVHRMSQLLRLSPEDTTDWLVAKIAAFRGCGENEIAAEMGIEVEA